MAQRNKSYQALATQAIIVSALHSLLLFVGHFDKISPDLYLKYVDSFFSAVPCEENMKKVKVKRVNRFDESTDIYTEFFKPYELTSFDDTFCIAMTNSAR